MGDVLVIRDHITHALSGALRDGEHGLKVVPRLVHRAITESAWKRRKMDIYNGRVVEFPTFVEYITTEPPEGLGASVELIKNLLRDHAEILGEFHAAVTAKHGGDRKSEAIKTNIISLDPPQKPQHGTAKAYTLSRLQRDHAALYDRVVAGELSPNAAAIEAGFRRPPLSPLEQILKLLPKLTKKERDRLCAERCALCGLSRRARH